METETQVEVTELSEPTESSVMTGEHPFADIAGESEPAVEPAPPGKPAVSYKTIKGEELADSKLVDYVRTLESQLIEEQARRSAFESVVKPADLKLPEPEPDPDLTDAQIAERFFTDPSGALAELRSQIKREILGEVGQKDEVKTFWEGFYSTHDDLRGAEDIVDMVLERKKAEFSRLPVAQASAKLADAVRDRIKAFRVEPAAPAIELADRPAHALSGSPAKAPRLPASAPVTPVSFISQLRARQNARRKQGA